MDFEEYKKLIEQSHTCAVVKKIENLKSKYKILISTTTYDEICIIIYTYMHVRLGMILANENLFDLEFGYNFIKHIIDTNEKKTD